METVYLLHFSAPVKNRCTHYLGYTKNLAARMERHRTGRGAKLCALAVEENIAFEIAQTWEVPIGQGRPLEIALKARHNHARLCPLCKANNKS